jgi:hypothetical protein
MLGEWTGSETLKAKGKRTYTDKDIQTYRENVAKAAGDKYEVSFDEKSGDVYARVKGIDAKFEKVLNDMGDASWDELETRVNANAAQVGTEVGIDVASGLAFDRKYGKHIKNPMLRFGADAAVSIASSPAGGAAGSVAQTISSGEDISTQRLWEKTKEDAIDNAVATMAGVGIIGTGAVAVRGVVKNNPFHTVKGGKEQYDKQGLHEVKDPEWIKAEDFTLNPVQTVKNMEMRYEKELQEKNAKLSEIAKAKAQAQEIYEDFGGIKEQADVIDMAGHSNTKEILGNSFNHSQERVNAEVQNALQLTQNFQTKFSLNNQTSADFYRFMRGGMQRVKNFYTNYYVQAQELLLKEMGDTNVQVASQTQQRLNELMGEAKHPLNVENTRLSDVERNEFNKDYLDLLSTTKRDFTEDRKVYNPEADTYDTIAVDTKSYTIGGLFDVQKKFNAFLYKHKDKFTKPQLDELGTIKDTIYGDIYRAIETRELNDTLKTDLKDMWKSANKGYSDFMKLQERSDILSKLLKSDEPFDVSKFAQDVFSNINKRDADDFDVVYTFGKELKKTGGDLDAYYSSIIDGIVKGAKDTRAPSGEISNGVMRTVMHQGKTLEIMDFDAFHKAFNSIDETTLKKIFGLTPRGEQLLQKLKQFDEIAKREAVMQQTLLNKEFKMSETAMQQHDDGKLFYSFAYGAKAMLWDSWSKYLMKNKAYEDFFLRAITKPRYEDIEPLLKKLDYDQKEVPSIQRVDIAALREELQAVKNIAQQSFEQLKEIEKQTGKSTNAKQVEDVTISGLLEYKATKDPSMRDFDVERVHAKELAKQEGMDESRVSRINSFDDLGRELRDFKLESNEKAIGNAKNPSLASVSDDAIININKAGDMPISKSMISKDWEQLKKMGLTETMEDESGAVYEVVSKQGRELLEQERQRRAKEYKPVHESQNFAGEKNTPLQIQKDDLSQFLQSNKPTQNTQSVEAPTQQLSSYELAKQEARFFSELLKKVYK